MRIKDFTIKTMLLLCSTVFVLSCSRDNNGENYDDNEKLSITIKENFTKDANKNLYNIMVGDTILYDVKITDNNPKEGTMYSIDLNNKDDDKHRRLNKDYEAFLVEKSLLKNNTVSKRDLEAGKLRVGSNWIEKAGEYVLFIVPLVPGTFQHDYSFGKQLKDETLLYTTSKNVNFNAVKLNVWYESVKTEGGSMFSHSKYRNEFYLRIDDGERKNDNYLSTNDGRKLSYTITYDNQTYTDEFKEGEDILFFYSKSRESSAPKVDNLNVERIVIQEKSKSDRDFFIEYNNVKLHKK